MDITLFVDQLDVGTEVILWIRREFQVIECDLFRVVSIDEDHVRMKRGEEAEFYGRLNEMRCFDTIDYTSNTYKWRFDQVEGKVFDVGGVRL
jgi:hypothetical protein